MDPMGVNISVMYKRGSKKIPEYLSHKQIKGRQKSELHRMTPN